MSEPTRTAEDSEPLIFVPRGEQKREVNCPSAEKNDRRGGKANAEYRDQGQRDFSFSPGS